MNKKKQYYFFAIILFFILISVFFFFKSKLSLISVDNSLRKNDKGELIVNTSLFPVYDFARIVGGDKVSVSLILPAGAEAHSYKPTEKDKETIKTSSIFFYTSDLMEPWAKDLKETTFYPKVIATAAELNNQQLDPHVWLDFSLAIKMVDNIKTAYQNLDPHNYNYYQENAEKYQEKLREMDNNFKEGLRDCQFREFISGGHQAFSYLANRYDLGYQSVQSYLPNNEINTERILSLIEELKHKKQPYVYYEELIMPYLAEVLRQGSGAKIMPLNSAHNVAYYDIEGGVTFLSLMEADLQILRMGLICK